MKTEANYVMRRGTETEPLALRDYCRQSGATVNEGVGRQLGGTGWGLRQPHTMGWVGRVLVRTLPTSFFGAVAVTTSPPQL